MSREPHSRVAPGVALAFAILALVVASGFVLAGVERLAREARELADGRASAAAAVEVAHAEALSRLLAALIFGGVLASLGAALAWHLVLRERSRARAVSSRTRFARFGLLAAGLAQELEGPLQEARELVLALREQVEDQPSWSSSLPLPESCDGALAELDRVEAALHDFVAYARPEPSPPRIADVAPLVREWVKALEPELAARDLALVLDSTVTAATAIADPGGLKQIFWTLVRNARDAAPHGSVVRVTLERDPERVCLRVADRGPGIAPERRDEVFEPFVSTKPDATGLGLAVAQRLADAMGATLRICGGPPGAVVEIGLRRAPSSLRFLSPPARALDPAA